jgi:hypothetical protein
MGMRPRSVSVEGEKDMIEVSSASIFDNPIRIAAVLDGDNIFRDDNGHRISSDLNTLISALRERGVRTATVCQNFFKRSERDDWQRVPRLNAVSTGGNCDTKVMLVAINYIMSGLDWLIIASGDGDYLPLVEAAQHAGTRVEIWARRSNASKRLVFAADSIRWIDDLVVALPRKQSGHRSVTAVVSGLAA